ncbi:hypothetical protein GCM10010377_69700 [Streptomyces viridiviolaceus]|uniref:Uncharacterized protein n=1 Tax=Streptomyces viridiviolaceus TaxID=68282 RepID=A0ABW2EBV1_9ACTN|nr:hypothetical protein [Streptomyces viridiviolaceus]GHB68994.1 hypothetical protein GCM10010377_69700 [Streptomyces viridiviolaceus]
MVLIDRMRVSESRDPFMSPKKGGQAARAPAIRGEHVRRAMAADEFERFTCAGEAPADDN